MNLRDALEINLALRQIPMAILPVDLSYDLGTNQETARKMGELYDDRKQRLVEKYATRNGNNEIRRDDKGIPVIEESERDAYTEELDEVLGQEIDPDKFVSISLSQLMKAHNLPYSAVNALRPILIDDRPGKKTPAADEA